MPDWSFDPCTICARALGLGAHIGDGDGTGQRFAHAECWRARAAEAAKSSPISGPLSEADLAEIEKRAAAATPGPWGGEQFAGEDCFFVTARTDGGVGWKSVAESVSGPDQEFIIAARADVPALVAEVRRLRSDNAFLRQTNIDITAERLSAEDLLKELLVHLQRGYAPTRGLIERVRQAVDE